LAALFLTVTSLTVHAEARWFEVELLLFQRNVDIQTINEHLSSEQLNVDTSNSINVLKAQKTIGCIDALDCLSNQNPTVISRNEFDEQGNNFKRLGRSRFQLTEQREKLEKHARFNPILHMAWRMPVVSGRVAQPLHLFAGKNMALTMQKKQVTALIDDAQATLTEPTTLSAESADSAVVTQQPLSSTAVNALNQDIALALDDKWAVDGNFKIYLDHYLFIDSQLIIRNAVKETIQKATSPLELIDDDNGVQIAKALDTTAANNAPTESVEQTVVKEVLFDQNRRLRSEEIHYLDHPLMGIIVQIRKIPKSELLSNE